MRLSRRSFLKGATASAVLAGSHVLGFSSRALAATGPDAPILVLVNLAGGIDLLGTVIPLDDVGGPQRSRYEALRPDLVVPLPSLASLSIDADPVLGTGLALHPSLAGLHALYGEGRLALVLGAGLAGSSLSHFEAEKTWFFGRPDVVVDVVLSSGAQARALMDVFRGVAARQLDQSADGQPHAVSFGGQVSPTFNAELATALGVVTIDRFELPDDKLFQWRDGAERGAELRVINGRNIMDLSNEEVDRVRAPERA